MSQDPVTSNSDKIYRGFAAADIEKESVVLYVICPELMPHAPVGEIAPGITNETNSFTNRSGKPVTSQVTSANHIVATWEGASNKRYPPQVRKGELVELYRAEGQDKYRWRSTGSGRDLRSEDRVVIEVGAADPNKPNALKDDTNTYSAYLDSIGKKVGMKTSKANGEVAAFSMEADLAAGTFYVSDDKEEPGNRIFLDTGAVSGIPIFQVNLASGVTLKLEGEDVFLKAPGSFFADISDRFVVNSPLILFNPEKKGTIIFNAASIAFNTAKDFVVSAGNVIGFNSASTKIGGILSAASAKIANAIKASSAADYKPDSVNDYRTSPVKEASNNADTSMSGPPYRSP